ncbi:unnamed protein product [Protopolystoma xenopodis]|uniref:Cadherin domain-containing protein n=1 Tax=Protopolystoma xenopodis TaxID=117903 RepID=A0A448XPF8_9PLAT|nr:unnamed protein product [Protopolystoma xenopodis]
MFFTVQIQATDKDAGQNGSLEFLLAGGNEQKLFDLNRVTGGLSFTGAVTSYAIGRHVLVVEARDRGQPPLVAQARLQVEVDASEPISPKLLEASKLTKASYTEFGWSPYDGADSGVGGSASGRSGGDSSGRAVNLYIIIAIVVASFVISTVLLTSICLVLRRARRDGQYRQVMRRQPAYISASITGDDVNVIPDQLMPTDGGRVRPDGSCIEDRLAGGCCSVKPRFIYESTGQIPFILDRSTSSRKSRKEYN